MRTLFASALFALACGCADRSSRPSGAGATPSIPGGPDPVVLRVAHDGGLVTAYSYPGLDSVLWKSSTRVPALNEIVAFGAEDGYLAALDAHGSPVRIDLRLGTANSSRDTALRAVSSFDGAAIYAVTPAGELTRFTPSGGDWKFKPPFPPSALFAQADGSLIVASAVGKKVVIWRIRPPGQEVVDTLSLDVGGDTKANAEMIALTAGSLGDRVFFGAHESVIAVRTRDMKQALNVDMGDPVTSIAATPSGDRLYVALAGDRTVHIVDRFEEKESGSVKLPGVPQALRMDALGRVLLGRGAADSVYVVSLATDAVQGTVKSSWRHDLPFVLPDGAIALVRGNDVVLSNPATLADGRTLARSGGDFWHGIRWNGFRPRAAGLDQPVEFRTSGSRPAVAADSGKSRDTARVEPPSPPSGPPTVPPSGPSQPAVAPPTSSGATPAVAAAPSAPAVSEPPRIDSANLPGIFTVSFAALQNKTQAVGLARKIKVNGKSPRITKTVDKGTTLYRVVLGPFPTRAAADRAGKASKQSFWIFEGTP